MTDNINEKVLHIFNTYYYNLIDDLVASGKSFSDNISSSIKVKNLKTEKYIKPFYQALESLHSFVFANDPDPLYNCNELHKLPITKGVSFADVLPDDKSTIAYYIYVLALYSNLYMIEDVDEKVVLFDYYTEVFKDIQAGKKPDMKGIYDQSIQNCLMNIYTVRNPVQSTESFENAAELLANTKIGEIAKEITSEIDLSKLNIDKPEDLLDMKKMFTQGSPISGIIEKVGTKIHDKIAKGEIKHEELMSETFKMLGALNQSGNPLLNSPLMKDLMKNMGSMGNMGVQKPKRSKSQKN
jgi:hypothetical protein